MLRIQTVSLLVSCSLCFFFVGCQEAVNNAATVSQGKSGENDQQGDSDTTTEVSVDATTKADGAENKSASNAKQEIEDTAKKPTELVKITFEDIELPIKENMVYRPQLMLTERAKELDGRRVRISGFMYSAVSKFRGIKNFIMVKNTECKYGQGGRADHLINVIMNEGESTFYRTEAIEIEGTLKINPFTGIDGNTWSIYDLACERVEKFRPRR